MSRAVLDPVPVREHDAAGETQLRTRLSRTLRLCPGGLGGLAGPNRLLDLVRFEEIGHFSTPTTRAK
jgi:hypothetical protein